MIPLARSGSVLRPELERLAKVTHGPASGIRLMLMLTAYLDESQDEKKSIVLCIGGMVAPASEWNCIWGEWAQLLNRYDLSEFHATNCVSGTGEFAAIAEPQRERMYWEFLSVITEPGWRIAHASRVHLEHYAEHRDAMDERRVFPPKSAVSGRLGDPYFLAFEHAIQSIATSATISALPPSEDVAFICDHNYLSGRAQGFYKLILEKHAEFRARLGTITFGVSNKVVPLQVADVIAFEYRRYEEDKRSGKDPRPQFIHLVGRFDGGWSIPDDELRGLAGRA